MCFTALFFSVLPGLGQAPPQPYAAIPRDAVSYSGPGRDKGHDLQGPEIRIGLLASLSGPEKKADDALVEAAQLAAEDENAVPFPGGRRLAIILRDQYGLWGKASKEVIHLTYEDQAVAVVATLDGGNAHLAEQVGNKIGIPILTLSTDPSTTETNIPWLFRLGPTDTQQARLFAQEIYVERKLKRVLLIAENDHDGRTGGEEFRKVARQLHAARPAEITFDPAAFQPVSIIARIQAEKPEALVLWTGHRTAANLVARFLEEGIEAPVYLCQKAAQGTVEESVGCECARNALTAARQSPENMWVAAVRPEESRQREDFESRFHDRTGKSPTLAAAQTYDAVRLLAAALRKSGPNRARLRDALAETRQYNGVSGVITFDHAGNDLREITLQKLP